MYCVFFTFGCKVNTCETAGMTSLLESRGFTVGDDPAKADVLIWNACTVTAAGDEKVLTSIRRAKKRYPQAYLVLTGCYAQAYPDAAAQIPEVDLCIGTQNRARLPDLLEALVQGQASKQAVEPYQGQEQFENLPSVRAAGHTRGFLKIQDGCNQFCAYCVIPYARGRCRSLPLDEVQRQAQAMVADGRRELVLCGINLGFYGIEWQRTLADAVETVCAVDPNTRVRLSSLEPDRLDGETLARLAACPNLCPQFHISVQSGCDATLKRMRRRYTTETYRTLCATLRRLFPACALTTDWMVGFPGETEEAFQASCAFMEEMHFASIHVFTYSPRPGTAAAAFPDQVPEAEKTRRARVARSIAETSKAAYLRAQIGKKVPVLFERDRGDGFERGHAPDGVQVRVQKNPEKDLRNHVFYVTIEKSDKTGCTGKLVQTEDSTPV